jgi:hypothetical protein
VGKGRQISAVIIDSVSRGRPKHIWVPPYLYPHPLPWASFSPSLWPGPHFYPHAQFSASSDLIEDARRDLGDLRCPGINVINGCQELDTRTKAFGLTESGKSGVLFSTYSTLASAGRGTKTRIAQILEWCGPEFEGVLAFDECHKAKNYSEAGEDGKGGTKVGAAVMELQAALPKARVLFASATGVSELKNMSYMTRLGLWGKGTAFGDFSVFHKQLEKRGALLSYASAPALTS